METDSGERVRRGWRSRWAAVGAAVAVSLGAGGGFLIADAASGPESSMVMIDPVRILDTRDPVNVGLDGPFVSPIAQKLQVTGSIPTSAGAQTVVPSGATGVLLNVTAVGASADGFISIRPGDATGAPATSSLNVTAGVTVPNAVQVALPVAGANAGQIDITWDALGVSGPTTDILIDVVGYTTDAKLTALQAEVDALEAANATQQGEIDALAVAVALDPVTLGQGIDWESNGNNTSKVLVFEDGTQIDDDVAGGTAHLSLIGPMSLDGGNYLLASVTYCVVAEGTGTVSEASIIGLTPEAGALETKDKTDRTTNGCFTITPTADVAATGAHQLMLFVLDTVLITQVTATWTPA
jgi:hypothetical protein